MPDNVDAIRWKIEEVDNEILSLIGKRMHLATQMGRFKLSQGLPIRAIRVEEQVLARYLSRSKEAGISEASAKKIAAILIYESLDEQLRLPKANEPKRVTVVGGSGKMGSWFCHFLRENGHKVIVNDIVSSTKFPFENNLNRAVSQAEVVVIATPISTCRETLEKVLALKPKGLVFDITSIKAPIIPLLEGAVAQGIKICSVHPMFGPDTELLLEKNILICDCGSQVAVQEAKELLDGRGATISEVPIHEHDKLMSFVLGMSHAISIAFSNALAKSGVSHEELTRASSTTYNHQECTSRKVVGENPDLYYEIQHLNPNTKQVLDLLKRSIEEIEEAAMDEESAKFVNIMESGRKYFGGRK